MNERALYDPVENLRQRLSELIANEAVLRALILKLKRENAELRQELATICQTD